MKVIKIIMLVAMCASLSFAQEKPRVFINGHGTINVTSHQGGGYDGLFGKRADSTIDVHNESIELTKDMRATCSGVVITLKERSADYVIMLNRESKAKVGLFKPNTQVLVANKQGDVIWAKDVRQVTSAAKDACAAIITAAHKSPAIAPSEQSAESLPAPIDENDVVAEKATASEPDPQQQQKYIRVVNGNGSVMFVPECIQTSTGKCK